MVDILEETKFKITCEPRNIILGADSIDSFVMSMKSIFYSKKEIDIDWKNVSISLYGIAGVSAIISIFQSIPLSVKVTNRNLNPYIKIAIIRTLRLYDRDNIIFI